MSKVSNPKRREIWLVNLNPTKGSEIRKERPCAVIGIERYMRPQMIIAVPITGWKSKYSKDFSMINIKDDNISGLDKESAADASQLRAMSTKRFVHRIGKLSKLQLEETVAAVVLCIGFEP